MDWINRYIDHPLLDGAAGSLRVWHIHTGQAPERLEPVWNIVVLVFLLVFSGHFLDGRAFVLCLVALVMLALPSVWRLVSSSRRGKQGYGAREYKTLRARAISNREAQWALRVMVLFASACLPFLAHTSDQVGAAFMLGGSLWFVLTAPAKFYLDAAEPPMPNDGDRAFRSNLQFG
jgi:hypothetical protein